LLVLLPCNGFRGARDGVTHAVHDTTGVIAHPIEQPISVRTA
jgi:hypothetical protein